MKRSHFFFALLTLLTIAQFSTFKSIANPLPPVSSTSNFLLFSWAAIGGTPNGAVYTMVKDPAGNLYVGGDFTQIGGVAAARVAKWDGSQWSALGAGFDAAVWELEYDIFNEQLVAGGAFTMSGSTSVPRIARWNFAGNTWEALGTGMNGEVLALAIKKNGEIFAGGKFTTAGGASANYVAKWDGQEWLAIGNGFNDWVYDLKFPPYEYSLYAAGKFTQSGAITTNRVAQWDGDYWTALGGNTLNGTARQIAIGRDGIYIGGEFTLAGTQTCNQVAYLKNYTWIPMGAGMDGSVFGLDADNFGNVYAVGDFNTAGGVGAARLARWTGFSWSGMDGGLNNIGRAVLLDDEGNLLLSGDFTAADGNASIKYLAEIADLFPIQNIPDSGSGGTITTCAAMFSDANGAFAPYQSNQNGQITFCPPHPESQNISIDFRYLALEPDYDSLLIAYAPTFTNGIGVRLGNQSNFYENAYEPTGCLTVKFVSDYSVESHGWTASVGCKPISYRSSDDCGNARTLTMTPADSNLVWYASSSFVATQSLAAVCSAGEVPDDDVWFKFTATAKTHSIRIDSDSAMAFTVHNSCSSNTPLFCSSDSILTVGCLVPGQEYFIRAYTKAVGGSLFFRVAVQESLGANCRSAKKVVFPTSQKLNHDLFISANANACSPANFGCLTAPLHPSFFYFKTETSGDVELKIKLSDPNARFGLTAWRPNLPPSFDPCGPASGQCAALGVPVVCMDTLTGEAILLLPNAPAGKIFYFAVLNHDNLADILIEISLGASNTATFNGSAFDCLSVAPACDCGSTPATCGLFKTTGTAYINSLAPRDGFLLFQDDKGQSATISAPFYGESLAFSIPEIRADTAQHTLTASFSKGKPGQGFSKNYTSPICGSAAPASMINPHFNYASTNAAGATSAALSVSETGAASYQIPIVLPQGTGGIQPGLSLTYNSNGGNGMIGLGWNLSGLSMIARSGNSNDVDDWSHGAIGTERDKLSLDGERLIQVNYSTTNKKYLKGGAEYRTKNDGFSKIVAIEDTLGAPKKFRVYTKSGLIMEYGFSQNSRYGRADAVFYWYLDRVYDTNGNYFTITYSNIGSSAASDKQRYPIRIDYTGNSTSSLTPRYTVNFQYASRTDSTNYFYTGGVEQTTKKLLKEILVKHQTDTVRRYVLNYDNGIAGSLNPVSRLVNVQECGSDGKCFDPTTFTWETETPFQFQTAVNNPIPKSAFNHVDDAAASGDFNGDGLSDVFIYNTTTNTYKLFLNRNNFSFNLHLQGSITTSWLSGLTVQLDQCQFFVEDFNGDNATDLLIIDLKNGTNRFVYSEPNYTRTEVYLSAFNAPNSFAAANDIKERAGGEKCIFHTGDFDANGLPEIFAYFKSDGANQLFTKVKNSAGDPIYQRTNNFLPFTSSLTDKNIRLIDLNGDGNVEVVWTYNGTVPLTSNWRKNIVWIQLEDPLTHYFSSTDDLKGNFQLMVNEVDNDANSQPFDIASGIIYFTDLNGDGLPDMVFKDTPSPTDYRVRINNGKKGAYFIGTAATQFNLTVPDGSLPLFTDFNLDGRSDYVEFELLTGNNKWFLNTGITFNGSTFSQGFDLKNTNLIPPASVSGCPLQPRALRKTSYLDAFWYNECSDTPAYLTANGGRPNFWWGNNFIPALRITSFTNGLGQRSTLEYAPSNDTSVYTPFVQDFGLLPSTVFFHEIDTTTISYQLWEIEPFEYTGRLYLVKKYSTDEGTAARSNEIRYHYQKSVFDRKGAGFRGFERVINFDQTAGIATLNDYKLMNPGNMSLTQSRTILQSGAVLLSDALFVDTIISQSFPATYTFGAGASAVSIARTYKTHFVPNRTSSTVAFDLDKSRVSSTSSRTQTDLFGNVTLHVINYGDGHIDSTLCTYANKTTTWHIGRLLRSELRRKAPAAPSIKRVAAFEYDSKTGLLKKETAEPDLPAPQRITTEYTRDAWGNITKIKKRFHNGQAYVDRYQHATFDATYRKFTTTSFNDLAHTNSATYDPKTGHKLSETSPNGQTTTHLYDGFGRLKRTNYPDGNFVEFSYHRCTTGGDCPPEAVFFVRQKRADGMMSWSYMDMLGREVFTKEKGFKGNTVFQKKVFNRRGLLTRVSDPYYAGETLRWSYFHYDQLGREISVVRSDGNATTAEFVGLTETRTNALGQKKKKEFAVNGRLKRVTDNAGNSIEYSYDAQGNTTQIAYPGGHAIAMTYNIYNHRTTVDDPDMGLFTYVVNPIGEIRSQTNPKGQVASFVYDTLGRPKLITEVGERTEFTYDVGANAKGMLTQKANFPTGSTAHLSKFEFSFDALSRNNLTKAQYAGDATIFQTTRIFDKIGRDSILNYPGPNGAAASVRQEYDSLGFFVAVRKAANQTQFFWKLDSIDPTGQIVRYQLGNGVQTTLDYDPINDHLTGIHSTNALNATLQDLIFTYDNLGNLQKREDLQLDWTENFDYDQLNRLTRSQVGGHAAVEMQYDLLGNITYKSDVGYYHYGENGKGPHQLTSIDLTSNVCVPSALARYTFTSYDKMRSVARGLDSVALDYSTDKHRFRQRLFQSGNLVKTKYYVLGLLEREITATATSDLYYINAPTGTVATVRVQTGNPAVVHYWLKDHLGSLHTVTNEAGGIVQVLGFDAWGRRRSPLGIPADSSGLSSGSFLFDRGFTGHEHIDLFDLINMNGRVYDPLLGRFISADPIIEDDTDLQALNRYAYVRNNPLSFTDPTGHWGFKGFIKRVTKIVKSAVSDVKKGVKRIGEGVELLSKGQIRKAGKVFVEAALDIYLAGAGEVNARGQKIFGKETWTVMVVTAATIAVGMATGGAGAALPQIILSGAAAGFTGSATGVIVNGGNVSSALKSGLKGAAIGAASAGLSYGVGELAAAGNYTHGAVNSANVGGYLTKVAGHAVVQGGLAELQGGSFGQGALVGAMTAAAAPLVGIVGTGPATRTITAAIIGGTASELGGGKFQNGAVSGAMMNMYNQETHWEKMKSQWEGMNPNTKLIVGGVVTAASGGILIWSGAYVATVMPTIGAAMATTGGAMFWTGATSAVVGAGGAAKEIYDQAMK